MRPSLGSFVVPIKEEPSRHLGLEAKVRELEVALYTATEKVEEMSAQVEKVNAEK